MTAKEYLLRYKAAKREAEDAERRITALRLKYALPGAIQYSDMPKGGGKVRDLSDYAAQLERLIDAQVEKYAKCMGVEADILARIDSMEDQEEREVLRNRYIDGMKWEAIANGMVYGIRHVHKIHGRALQEFPVPE